MKYSNFKFLAFAFLLAVPASAQTMRYVAYFPTPHAYYSDIKVADSGSIESAAILAARGEIYGDDNSGNIIDLWQGKVVVGSAQNPTASLNVADNFYAQELLVRLEGTGTNTGTNLIVGHLTATTSTYAGSYNSLGSLLLTGTSINATTSAFNSLKAYNNLYIKSLIWEGKGGIGQNKSGTSTWSTCPGGNLVWRRLHIDGTNEMRTYLTCT